MKFNLKKELPLLLLSFLPGAFLAYIWNTLPAQVPLQWGLDGEINRYGNKIELLIIGLIPVFLYTLFLFIPLIDPKKRLDAMGNKFYTIRLITALFIAVLFTLIVYWVKEQSMGNPNYLYIIIGAFFVLLGNYFKTIKPNYFVGIRTPWTLENEGIWKSTHKLGGKLWVAGGLLIIFSSVIFNEKIAFIIFLTITAIITLIPVAHSYLKFKKTAFVIILLLISTSFYGQGKYNRPQTPEPPFDYHIENVSFANIKDSVTLAGTLTFPKSGTNFPVVVLITGSGPQDRNEEIFEHKPFWVLADYLTNKGIAVLRYDDRGFGESTGDFSSSTSIDFGRDVLAAIDYLKTRKEFNPKRIGLIGHSEGGVIAPMIAAQNSDVAFVVSLAGVMIPGGNLLILQKEMQLRSMGSSEEFIAKQINFDTGLMKVVTNSTIDSLKVNLEKYASQYFKDYPKFAAEQGLTEVYYKQVIVDTYSNPWISNLIKYDPKKSLENLDCPLLALNGEKDLQVPVKENFEALQIIMKIDPSKKFTLKSYPDLNHLFQECETGAVREYSQIEQTLSPTVLKDIYEWISNLN